ncbi:hypothetical protein [Brevundimonas mediterranea]|jgi:hypothetical protein|uniref:Uncharacterized protein n=1 Tax=Brevundimonas mediterranea TaxID=74329 RepID=A0A7Z9C811_9CAUL|nr:hypothetical protein [Brevundimonas mediterranea]VDC51408.1 hypothetical protein BREV_BREV_00477 [Brevundimonas mediterranea]
MRAPDHLRLENQTRDAAARLHRTTALPALTATLREVEGGGVGCAWAAENMTLGEIEFVAFVLLDQLTGKLAEGAAEGCENCTAGQERVTAAVAILRPGLRPIGDAAGHC